MKAKKATAAPKVPMCYCQSGTRRINWGNVVAVEKRNNATIVRFDNGGWNPADSCFLTEAQCRKFHKMPDPQYEEQHNKIADALEQLARTLRA